MEGLSVGPKRGADMPHVAVIDLTDDDHEAQVAIRHRDGQVLVLTVKARLNSITVIGPIPTNTRLREGSSEMATTWRFRSESLDECDT